MKERFTAPTTKSPRPAGRSPGWRGKGRDRCHPDDLLEGYQTHIEGASLASLGDGPDACCPHDPARSGYARSTGWHLE
jgi:hypothetical protein